MLLFSQTACLSYHNSFRLSTTFFKVFWTFWIVVIVWIFLSFQTTSLSYHKLCSLSTTFFIFYFGRFTLPNDSYGNRTRVTAVKGRCLNRLTKEPFICLPDNEAYSNTNITLCQPLFFIFFKFFVHFTQNYKLQHITK